MFNELTCEYFYLKIDISRMPHLKYRYLFYKASDDLN